VLDFPTFIDYLLESVEYVIDNMKAPEEYGCFLIYNLKRNLIMNYHTMNQLTYFDKQVVALSDKHMNFPRHLIYTLKVNVAFTKLKIVEVTIQSSLA